MEDSVFLGLLQFSSMMIAPLKQKQGPASKYHHFTGCLAINSYQLLIVVKEVNDFVLLSFSMCSCQCTYDVPPSICSVEHFD